LKYAAASSQMALRNSLDLVTCNLGRGVPKCNMSRYGGKKSVSAGSGALAWAVWAKTFVPLESTPNYFGARKALS
jgi:hypothetical protein